jgi:TolB-like protein
MADEPGVERRLAAILATDDPNQERLAGGLTQDVITDLQRFESCS